MITVAILVAAKVVAMITLRLPVWLIRPHEGIDSTRGVAG
jgi:hypothetical protein